MAFLFQRLSYGLLRYPLATNCVVSGTIGFCGDIVCQTVHEPWTANRPPLTREMLPTESARSVFLVEMVSPYLYYRAQRAQPAITAVGDKPQSSQKGAIPCRTTVLVDLRRSAIFSSFTVMFGVPFFLKVYRVLDRLIPPQHITKPRALYKGFLSWVAATLTNPLYFSYVTAMSHFFIYRDGRDGRRRVTAIASGGSDSRPLPARRGWPFVGRDHVSVLQSSTVSKLGFHYRFVQEKTFNFREYLSCVAVDTRRKLAEDLPEITKIGFVFWGMNWLPLFYYISPHYRLVYSSVLQVLWSGIMSHYMHRGVAGGSENAAPTVSARLQELRSLLECFMPAS